MEEVKNEEVTEEVIQEEPQVEAVEEQAPELDLEKFESKDDYSTKITNRIKASFKNVTIDYIRYHECPDGLHICEIKINRLVRTGNPCKYKDKYYERSVDTTREISMDQEINFIDHWKDN